MPIDTRYIPAFNLENTFIDKDTGEPMAGGKIYFYQDNQRATLKNVWQITGSSPNYTFTQLPNPITLSSIGTIQDSLGNPVIPYFLPEDSNGETELYFVSVENADGVFQFSREAVPHVEDSGGDDGDSISFTNELSNPQFVEVSFNGGGGAKSYTFSSPSLEVTPIAPDWDMIVSGTGSVTVSVERISYVGSLNRPTNPPYFLRFTTSGTVTLLQLRQRLFGSPNLWAGENVSATLVGRSLGADASFTMKYIDSSGNTDENLIEATFPSDNSFAIYSDVTAIPVSTSADEAPDAYIDIVIDLPPGQSVEITSIQVVGIGNGTNEIAYDQSTQNRQIDQLFHYYQNELLIKPKNTILTAWNFALNPWQFRDPTIADLSGTGEYVADQTIVITENADSVQVGRNDSINGMLDIRTKVGETQGRIAVIQYIDPTTIRQYWGAILSSLVRARIQTTAGSEIPFKMRLIQSDTLPTTVNPIGAWGSVDPVFTAQWTAIEPENDPTYTLPDNWDPDQAEAVAPPFAFNGFKTEYPGADTATLGIVWYTTEPLDDATADAIVLDSISLVPNEFAVETNPQTYDAVLRQCQFYYEKTYPASVIPGDATTFDNVVAATQSIYGAAVRFQFQIHYAYKRAYPTIEFYSPTSTTANLLQYGVRLASSYPAVTPGTNPQNLSVIASPGWTRANRGPERAMFIANDVSQIFTLSVLTNQEEKELLFHNTIDARLGLVP